MAYNTYLLYGALTNNPDTQCNILARTENQNQASIITGLVIACLSVTWMAYNSAGSMYSAVARESAGNNAAASNPYADRSVVAAQTNPASAVKDWPKDSAKDKDYGAAAQYAAEDADDEEAASPRRSAAAARAAADDHDRKGEIEPRPWVFHLVMFLGGCYLAMVITNWGQPSDEPGANPELSVASMWVRIGTQWGVHVVYLWTLIAPTCCPNRDFS